MTVSQPSLKLVLAGGASLAVLALAIVSTAQLNRLPPRTSQSESQPIAGEPSGKIELKETAESRQPAQGRSERANREADALAMLDETAPTSQPVAPSPPVLAYRQPSPQMLDRRQTIGRLEGVRSTAQAPAELRDLDQSAAHRYQDQGRDRFTDIEPNPIKVVREEPVSTFSIDVDTASYAFVRASLNRNVLPQKDAVRVEELINYFPYAYPAPEDRAEPFRASVAVFPTPWNLETRLIHIGIKGYTLPATDRPRANLVFLIDTSGSMHAPDKLPLLQNAFKLLVSSLEPDDTIAIVTYAGAAGTALEPTKISDKAKILAALDGLAAGGSTAGAEGIRQAYQLAEQNFDPAGINRVILATDGDFNVGITDIEELKSFVERKRQAGVYLSVLGFGMGNYNDELMQTLAQNGNGNAAYIDSLNEARKVLVEEAGSTIFTIANDVKLQVEFNPQTVSEYRLIGYETRLLNREDFNNDKVDAGDIGAGHTVTALYEIVPVGSGARLIDDLRYQAAPQPNGPATDEYGFLKIRYKLPDSDTSRLITAPITAGVEVDNLAATPQEARFAAAVAAFGQVLRGGRYTGSYGYDDVIALAQGAKGADEFGYRAELINLVRLAKSAAALEPLNRP